MPINLGDINKTNREKNYVNIGGLSLGKNVSFPTKTSKTSNNNKTSKYKYIAKNIEAGLVGGTTNMGSALLTDLANNFQKGKDKGILSSAEDLITTLNPINNLTNMAENYYNVIKDNIIDNNDNKNVAQRYINFVKDMLSQDTTIDKFAQVFGSVMPDTADDKLLKVNEVISKPYNNLSEELQEMSTNQSTGMQLLGSGLQSAANMIPSAAVSYVTGDPTLGLTAMGLGAKGTTTNEKIKAGKTLNEAVKAGNIDAAIEVGTEMLTGGVKIFGKGTLDDAAESTIKKLAKTKLQKELLQRGFSIGGEVLEETISDVLGTALDYGEDADASYSWKDWGETAVSTVISTAALNLLTGGLAGGVNNVSKNNTLNKYAKEQSISKQTAKAQLEETTKANLPSFKEELGIKNDDITSYSEDKAIKNQLQSGLLNQMKRGIFVNEADKSKAFQYNETDNEQVNNMLKKLSEKGNNTVENHATAQMAEKLIRDFGFDVGFTNNEELKSSGRAENAAGYKKGNKMVLNLDSKKLSSYVMGHETTHFLENTELYDAVSEAVYKLAKTRGVHDNNVANIKKTYAEYINEKIAEKEKKLGRNLSKEEISKIEESVVKSELTANYVGSFFTDIDFFRTLGKGNPSRLQQFAEVLQKLWYKATNQKEKAQILEAQQLIRKVYAEYTNGGQINLSNSIDAEALNKAPVEQKQVDSTNIPTIQETKLEQTETSSEKVNIPIVEKVETNNLNEYLKTKEEYDKTNDSTRKNELETKLMELEDTLTKEELKKVSKLEYKSENAQKNENNVQKVEKTEDKSQSNVDNLPTKTKIDNQKGIEKIKSKYDAAEKIDGSKKTIVLASGEKLSGTYKMLEAGNVAASHNAETFAKTEGFPTTEKGTTVNDRDYQSDRNAQNLVNQKAGNYDGRAFADNGVIVTKDGIVISGNDRTMSGDIAAKNGTDTAYIEYLKDNAEQFGFTIEQIESMDHPRVVLELNDNVTYDTKTFAKFNKDSKKSKSVSEKAKEIGKTIDNDTIKTVSDIIEDFDTIDDLYNNERATRELLNILQTKGIVDGNEVSEIYNGSKFTGTGKDLIESVVLGSVISEENAKYFSNNNDLKFKVMKVAPAIIQNKTLNDYSINDIFNDAIEVYKKASSSKLTIDEFTGQYNIFGDNNVDLVTKRITQLLETKGYKNLKNFIEKYNAMAELPAAGQTDIFSAGGVETKEDILKKALNIDDNTEIQYLLSGTDSNMDLSKKKKLELAQYLKNKKLKDKFIWALTGWQQDNIDGQWKYEIADPKLKKDIKAKIGQDYRLEDMIDAKALFKAYPQLRNYEFSIIDMTKNNLENTTRGVFAESDNGGYGVYLNKNNSIEQMNKTLAHEIQHAIQVIEGFAGGSSKAFYIENGKILGVDLSTEKARNLYKRTAGEVESRNVANRTEMSAIQKAFTRPSQTRDIKDSEIIKAEELTEAVNKKNANTQYMLSDNTGRELTDYTLEKTKNSKVRDENGILMLMYHGSPNGTHDQLRAGTYFTPNKDYAERYTQTSASSISSSKVENNPKVYESYLNIEKPFDINDPEARSIYINDYIKGGNAMGINPYMSDAEYNKIKNIDWTEVEDLKDFLQENGYDYDGIIADEGADGGYGNPVIERGLSYIPFSEEQIIKANNNNTQYMLTPIDQLDENKEYYFRGQTEAGDKIAFNNTQFQGDSEGGVYFTTEKETAYKYGNNVIAIEKTKDNVVTIDESNKLQEWASKIVNDDIKNQRESDYVIEQMALGRPRAFAEYTGKPFVETGDLFGEPNEAIYYEDVDNGTSTYYQSNENYMLEDNNDYSLYDPKNKFTNRLSDGKIQKPEENLPTAERPNLQAKEVKQYQTALPGFQDVEVGQPTRSEIITKFRDLAKDKLGNVTKIKDKKKGILYQINTMKRNLRDIMTPEQAADMYDTYFKPITENNAATEKDITSYNERIQKYNLTNEESVYTQLVGELKYNPESQLTSKEVESYYQKNSKKINKDKVNNAVEEFRNIYDELIGRINDTLVENGYKPIEYRKGYFPHFIEEKATSPIGKLAEKLGWRIKNGELPTDISGITDQFKPGKAWTSFSQHRTGDATDYNALKGLDNYLRGAMDVIHHTEDIQKLRALENEIRYQFSDKGIQEKIDNIYMDEDLDADEKYSAIYQLTKDIRNSSLGNFATEIRNYTDNLANKKSFSDRSMEQAFGRDTYSIMQNINSRVSANMVGANISSALTNFIPITQAWSQVSTKNLMKGMYESIKTSIKNDGFANNSVYLTNRTKQAERLYKTGLDKINEKLGVPFEAIDSFTSNTIVRAKYYENLDKGMSEQEAISNADEFAKDVMAGRSKGDMPTIMNQKNPLVKLMTAFQLEVNNQYGYMFKDIKADLGGEAKDKLAAAFIKMFFGAWLYNYFAEKITGRKSAFSPIDMAIDDIKTATNENMDLGEKISSIAKDTAKELPFVGGLMGGGRLPIQGAIPYENPLDMVTETISDVSKAFDEDESKKKTAINNLVKEWSKPIYYIAMPFAGGQIKKTVEGLSMYDENLPVAGSYTNSGKLRFEADDSVLGKLQAAVFGQYASENARNYFDNGYTPLTEKQVNTALDAGLSIDEYREYNSGIKKQENNNDKIDYIYNLPLEDSQKNVLANSILNRKEDIDISNYGDYNSLEEFDYANNNPEKYAAITQITDFNSYNSYKDEISSIKEQYTDTNERKSAVFSYINSLSLNKYQKTMLYKLSGGYSIKSYKNDMFNYIESLELTAEDKQTIYNELFK